MTDEAPGQQASKSTTVTFALAFYAFAGLATTAYIVVRGFDPPEFLTTTVSMAIGALASRLTGK